MTSRPPRLALLIAAAGALVAMPAGAQAPAKPVPTACAPFSFTDPAGDADLNTLAQNNGAPPSGQKPPDSHDITTGFFRYAPDAAGQNVLTANIVVTNLDKSVQPGSLGVEWLMRWTLGGATYSAVAQYTEATDALTATAGGTATNAPRVDTTATLFEGKDGIVSIVIPVKDPALGGMDGKSITGTHAWSKVDFQSAAPNVDEAPNDEAGKAFKVIPCADGAAPTPGTNPPPPATPPNTSPPSPAPPAGPATLALKVVAGKQAAKKVSKARRLVVRLQAGEPLKALTATLKAGKRTVGKGKLASIGGKGKLTLKVPKKIKKATYTLSISATKADGRKASTAVQVRIR